MAETERSVGEPVALRTRDLLGQELRDAAGEKVGTVADLLIDRTRGTIRLLDVDLGMFRKHVLIPADAVDWGREGALVLGRWTRAQVHSLPGYTPDLPLTDVMIEEMAVAHPRYYGDALDAPPPVGEGRAVPLREAKDIRISGDASDLRGWNVFGSDGERLGVVADLLVDPVAMKVRYASVDLLEDLFTLKEDRHVLIPIEFIELKERGKDAWVLGLTAAEAARLPAYTGGPIDPLVETRVRSAFRA